MPLATNMCVVAFGDPPEAIAKGAVQVVLFRTSAASR